jgi:predicted AAA+ superfamily ATPase
MISALKNIFSLVVCQVLNFANISSEVGGSSVTIREYYSILEDTLVGFFVQPWVKSKKRKPISTAKFYFGRCRCC